MVAGVSIAENKFLKLLKTDNTSRYSMKKKTLIIGIDGATWSVITPMLKSGKLPTLNKIINSGVSGILKSRTPIISPVAWTTIMTGKLRVKHGVTGFFSIASDIKCPRIWDILQKNNINSGTIGHLLTSPPDKKLVFQIPGWMSTSNLVHPEEFKFFKQWERTKRIPKSLKILFNYFSLNSLKLLYQYRKYRKTELEPRYQLANESMKTDIFLNLLKKYNPSFSTIMFYGTDFMLHQYIHQIFPERFSKATLNSLRKTRINFIEKMFTLIDNNIKRILNYYKGEDINLIFTSDHGFQSLQDDKVNRKHINKNVFLKRLDLDVIEDSAKIGPTIHLKIKKDNLKSVKDFLDSIYIVEINKPLLNTEIKKDEIILSLLPEYITNKIPGLKKMSVIIKNKTLKLDELLFFGIRSGRHSPDGIFIMNSSIFKNNITLKGTCIEDITPTILYSLGLPIGKDMDGKVLINAFKDTFTDNNKIKYIDTWDTDFKQDTREEKKDTKELEGRLKELGYL